MVTTGYMYVEHPITDVHELPVLAAGAIIV
jgi:hypothetical protein